MTQKKFHRNAVAKWNGSLKDGNGTISTDSQALNSTPFSFSTRFGNVSGTNPEELIAAAHAACFTMAFSYEMKKLDLFPTEIETRASVFLENTNDVWTVAEIVLQVWTPGEESEEKVRKAAEIAKKTCPISKLLKANIKLNLDIQNRKSSISA